MLMVIQYNMADVEITYPANVQEFLYDIITGLHYPVKFPYPCKILAK